EKLRKEFSAMLYAAQKANNNTTKLTFLFSSKSFDQLVMRLQYMEQYAAARRHQAQQIKKVQEELSTQVAVIKAQRDEKNVLLADQLRESESLVALKDQQNKLLRSLAKEEKNLKRDLENTK